MINDLYTLGWASVHVRYSSILCASSPVDLRYISSVTVPCPLVVRFRRYICVSPPLASGTRPLHLRFVRSTSGCCPVVTRVYRTYMETQRTATEDVTDEYRTEQTPTGCLSPFYPVESFEHVQNLPPDRTGTNGHHRTSNVSTERVTDD